MRAAAVALAALLVAACDGYRAPTYSTLTAMAKQADDAREKLPKACEDFANAAASKKATLKEAVECVDRVFDQCDATLAGIEAASKALRVARDGVAGLSAALADPESIAKWAVFALKSYQNMAALLGAVGVKLPALPGVK